ncbi:hypothetical protein B0H66DRAFT_358328 [Apodospora peruviana]|uniref:AAA+ ATPase domain-containing protein n=1 Tax=Apodospora peruviana TaxID=516989 RepID=A0AAE0HXA6_9PEZI|nr:hypothetical protein B0H66DRAFT_358328 [Apodospora peruviana]
MGSLAVLTMAEDVSAPAQTNRQPLHPFFAPSRLAASIPSKCSTTAEQESVITSTMSTGAAAEEKSGEDVLEKSSGRLNKRRKVDPEQTGDDEEKKPRGRKRARPSAGGDIADLFGKIGKVNGIALNEDASNVVAPSEEPQQAEHVSFLIQKENIHGSNATVEVPPLPDDQAGVNQSSLPPSKKPPLDLDDNPPKPKKLLQFNPKTGTIGSPPKPKQPKAVVVDTVDGGRKDFRKAGTTASKLVKIEYGEDPESRARIGEKIEALLSGEPLNAVEMPKELPQSGDPDRSSLEVAKPKAPMPSKSTHPFFLGKVKKAEPQLEEPKESKMDSPPAPKRPKQYTSTPCSPKKPRAAAPNMRMPQFGTKNAGLKFPGSRLPAWPWKDTVHVRGFEEQVDDVADPSPVLTARKSKGHSVKVPISESIIDRLTQELEVPALAEAVRNVNTDEFLPAPPELRLPQKHLESGIKLQARILPELRTFHSGLSARKLVKSKRPVDGIVGPLQPPPQLANLFNLIRSGLSAFDRSQCETANWTQKYAPTSAVEVLQSGKEAFLLRDWLQALMVQSVDTGSTDTDKSKSGVKAKAAGPGKKRRKKLDGFIVSSDDEDNELAELSDAEADWTPSGSKGILKKTVVRSGDLRKGKEGAKIANTLIISGPHGCGKTAAVYAVAKELGYEVFEINSGGRRSGKDIMEKIGDMTRNHHVRQHQPTADVDDGEAGVSDDEVAKDLKSGKQSTMNAFFKPKPAASKPKRSTGAPPPVKQKEAKKEASKNQRQSLILLEEVDILYEEDKQFWATVMGLIVQSKRPFIMTCNDETLVPLQTLRLHGIFRFSPPPRELAIDRLVLIAANEGHALQRKAVESLYESRHQDMRAATMDLQYWCQIGVGDRRGGFEWFYLRWPRGIDLDEDKEVVRVVSQGTYHAGMNWLGRDSIVDPKASPRTIEEELLHQTWESWGVDIGNWEDSVGLDTWAESIGPVTNTGVERVKTLEAFDYLAETLSAADVSSYGSFAMFKEELLDTTLPELSPKAQEDYIIGLQLLDAPNVTRYDSLVTSLPSALKSLAKATLKARMDTIQKEPTPQQLVPLDEPQVLDYIQTSFNTPLPGTPEISRIDLAFAFDPISESDSSPPQPASYLDPSVFDRTLELIVLDVAPYVRGIVVYDSHLQRQRLKLSNLISEGGRKATQGSKRMRTTRAALSALEGGSRSTTRGEKWFKADINPHLVMKTAGRGWAGQHLDVEAPPVGDVAEGTATPSSPSELPSPPPRKKAVPKGRGRGRPRKKIVEDDGSDELDGDSGEVPA